MARGPLGDEEAGVVEMSDPVTPGRRARTREQLRPRGQTLVALVLVGILVAGALLTQGVLGERDRGTGAVGIVASGAWYCPHGGGKDWEAVISVANPGSEPVEVRARRLGPERGPGSERVRVPPGGSVELVAPATDRGSATVVEYFGGHVAAGWVARTGGDDVGISAEPCLSEAGPVWTLGDGTAEAKEEQTFVVVMNPFSGDAVFTLEVLRASDPPGNVSEWDDYVLPAGRSVAFELDEFAEGDRVLGATITSSLGRVAASTLGISKDRGVRGVIGWQGPTPSGAYLPGAGQDGDSVVTVIAPEDRSTAYAASMLGSHGSQVFAKGKEQLQRGETAQRLDIAAPDPSTIWLRGGRDRPGVFATRRTSGRTQDLGATAGAPAPGAQWIVFPSVGEAPQQPVLVVTNPGADAAEVTLTTLPREGDRVTRQLQVRPGRTVEAPTALFGPSPRAPVLVRVSDGAVVTATASYSQGKDGVAAYAVSAGAPIDPAWVADPP